MYNILCVLWVMQPNTGLIPRPIPRFPVLHDENLGMGLGVECYTSDVRQPQTDIDRLSMP